MSNRSFYETAANNLEQVKTWLKEKDDFNVVTERIYESLVSALETDPLLIGFDVIPQESQKNNSPVHHLVRNHQLGLESWCVPYVYLHAYKQFICCRKRVLKNGPLRLDKKERQSQSRAVRSLLNLSKVLLLLNADLTVAWNTRRLLVSLKSTEDMEQELKFISLAASRKPKIPEGFYYRRWVVEKCMGKNLVDCSKIVEFHTNEIVQINPSICSHKSNYHAWGYRSWLLQFILNHNSVENCHKETILEEELRRSDMFTPSFISDFSGFHYRHVLLNLFTKYLRRDVEQVLKQELEGNKVALLEYIGHEALWQYRRSVLFELMFWKKHTLLQNQVPLLSHFSPYFDQLLKLEEDMIVQLASKVSQNAQFFQSYEDIANLNKKYSVNHLKWLQLIKSRLLAQPV